MSDIDFPPEVDLIDSGRVDILALSGGGYRGLFAACVLAELELLHGKPAGEAFRLLAGTSIGGILACALAVGIPAATVRDAFIADGQRIFGSGRRPARLLRGLRGLVAAKYSSDPLREVIARILGDHASMQLGDLKKPLVLPTVSVSNGAPLLLRSDGLGRHQFQDTTLLDAALATAAAPTYFPSRRIGLHTVIDGGLVANAPDMVALTEALRHFGMLENIHVLSIGTCGKPMEQPPGDTIHSGQLAWLLSHNLIELTLAAQERLVVSNLQTLMSGRFVRIDAQPTAKEQRHLALDKAGARSGETLQMLAERAMAEAVRVHSQPLADFFR